MTKSLFKTILLVANYTAQHKLELFLIGFSNSFQSYRHLTSRTLRSHVEAKYGKTNLFYLEELDAILEELSKRELNNPAILPMIRGYFDDMFLVFRGLQRIMKPKSKAAFVVCNSCWSGVTVEVDKLLSKIAIDNGFLLDKIVVTRYKLNSAQQIRKYGKKLIRESILLLRKG